MNKEAQDKARAEKLNKLYKDYGLTQSDVFKHKHYTIISLTGIEKMEAKAGIHCDFDPVQVTPEFAAVKCTASMGNEKTGRGIITFGSAKFGKMGAGNTQTHYVLEMAEKRARSRAVLKLLGYYAEDVKGAVESDEFTQGQTHDATNEQYEIISDLLDKARSVLNDAEYRTIELRIEKQDLNADGAAGIIANLGTKVNNLGK